MDRPRVKVSHPRTLNKQVFPRMQIYAMDIEDLYVTQDPLAVHLLEVDALNVEEDMDLIPSIKFLAHNTGRRLSQLEGRIAGNGCSLRSKFPCQEICRWHEGGVGMYTTKNTIHIYTQIISPSEWYRNHQSL